MVLSDIRMVEMDGMAVLREVKRAGQQTPVILMTGFGSMDGAIEAIQEGAFDYVSKPFKIDGPQGRGRARGEALGIAAWQGASPRPWAGSSRSRPKA